MEHRLEQLEAREGAIVVPDVCDLVRSSYSSMVMKYPRVKALLHEYWKNRAGPSLAPRLDEEEKVQRVHTAINVLVSHGEAVTLKRIRQIVRLTQQQFRRSPRGYALMTQYTAK